MRLSIWQFSVEIFANFTKSYWQILVQSVRQFSCDPFDNFSICLFTGDLFDNFQAICFAILRQLGNFLVIYSGNFQAIWQLLSDLLESYVRFYLQIFRQNYLWIYRRSICQFSGDLFFQEIPLLHIYLILLENLSIQQYHAIFVINFTAIYLPFFRRVFQSILSIKTILGVSIHLFSVREAYPRDVTGSPPIPWWTKRFSTSTEFNRKSGTG